VIQSPVPIQEARFAPSYGDAEYIKDGTSVIVIANVGKLYKNLFFHDNLSEMSSDNENEEMDAEFRVYIDRKVPFEMVHLGYNMPDGKFQFSFGDGRHRMGFLARHGLKEVPLIVSLGKHPESNIIIQNLISKKVGRLATPEEVQAILDEHEKYFAHDAMQNERAEARAARSEVHRRKYEDYRGRQ